MKCGKVIIGIGLMNDFYMLLEKQMKLIGGVLEIIVKYCFFVYVIIKSSFVICDVDVLQDIGCIYVVVSFIIIIVDDEMVCKLEFNVLVFFECFKVMKILFDWGIYIGVVLMFVLFFINDFIEDIEEIVEKVVEVGVFYVFFLFGVILRWGFCDYFYDKVEWIFLKMVK